MCSSDLLPLPLTILLPPPLLLDGVSGTTAATVKLVIVRVLLTLPEASATMMVQSEYVPLAKDARVMVLLPSVATVVAD